MDFAQARMYANKLGRFTTVDPSRRSITAINPQTWNRYVYCYNNPLILVDSNGKWPTTTHNRMIDKSFGNLSDRQRSLIKKGSAYTDWIGGKLGGTLRPSEAHKHVITQEGLTPDEAHKKTMVFLKDKLAKVQRLQKDYEAQGGKGISETALVALGTATHVYEDMTSPAHGYDKTYGIPTKKVVVLTRMDKPIEYTKTDYGKLGEELAEHKAAESMDPTAEQYQETADRSRAFFLLGFGKDKFKALKLSEEDTQRVYQLLDREKIKYEK